jgi:hypothetical protein
LLVALTAGFSALPSPAAELPQGSLWSADHESGNLSAEWQHIWISGQAHAAISASEADPQNFFVALTIFNANGSASPEPGVRLTKIDTPYTPTLLPTSAYYSVWYYFPQVVAAPQWWNVFQWKRAWQVGTTRSSDPVYTINVGNRPDGAMYFYLYQHVGADGRYNTAGAGAIAAAPFSIMPNRWTHLECAYVWSASWSGTVRCWQDGAEIWNKTALKTEFDEQKYLDHVTYPRQWSVNNYASLTIPDSHTLYIDDAAISTVPVGGGAGAALSPGHDPAVTEAPSATGTPDVTPTPPTPDINPAPDPSPIPGLVPTPPMDTGR